MIITIKQLKLVNDELIFVPQTVSEAVLVKNSNKDIITLNEALDTKIENIITASGSGLSSTRLGTTVFITLSDVIEPNQRVESTRIQYDSKGRIIKTAPTETLTITVDNNNIEYDGNTHSELNFGNDFTLDQNKIKLKWTKL